MARSMGRTHHSSGRRNRLLLGDPQSWTFAEPLIERDEDRTLRAVLIGMLWRAIFGGEDPMDPACHLHRPAWSIS
jgi:hypothetical protein